ncbi:flagellar basal body-associated FliL family protein [Glaciimonas soli]|uniref:Flagellar protein FliL n=1 Tax=Glaciimonas soli TaxID=2590999 RepID=A0A843YI61_9BURK|nr:flagellar basal body-associated FliL family protein [Glaciimonas soli]MQQ99448.1 flagellar basal body-associated protein FliL [Glaciimonas soli]
MATIKAEQANSSKKKIGLILAILIVLAAICIGGAYNFGYLSFHPANATSEHNPADAANKKTIQNAESQAALEAPIFVTLEPFTVNLQQQGRDRFLHVGLVIKVADAKTKTLLTDFLPEARSRVLTLLADRSSESLDTPESKRNLAAEVAKSLSVPFFAGQAPLRISGVLFTTFIVQ